MAANYDVCDRHTFHDFVQITVLSSVQFKMTFQSLVAPQRPLSRRPRSITVLSYLMCYVFITFCPFILPGMVDISGEEINPVPITPSWSKAEVPTLF